MPIIKSSSTWSSNLNLNLAILSYSMGLSIPRMTSPWLLRTKIGIPLLIPVLLFVMVVFTAPYIFMEIALGQYSNKATIKVWELCPVMRGVGICSFTMFLIYQTYYTFLCNCTFSFAFLSLSKEQLWKSCNKSWNKINCFTLRDNYTRRLECSQKYSTEKCDQMKWQSSVEQFYFYRILNLNGSSTDPPQEELLIYALITMTIIFLSNYGGPRTTEKILIFLAIVPTLQIIVLFFVPLLSSNGPLVLHHLFTHFDKSELKNLTVWAKLIQLSLSSLGLGFGAYVTFGTHFSFRSPLHFKAIGINLTNVLMTVFYTIVLQNFLVSLCFQSKMFIEDFFSFEQELKLPEAVFFLEHSSQFWATMWLSNSYFLGLRSLIVMMVINAEVVYNTVPAARKHHNICILFFCVVIYSAGIFFSTRTGYQVVKILEKITNEFSLTLLNIFNLIGVGYVYGIKRFRDDIFFMLGIKSSLFWNALYVLGPIVLTLTLTYNIHIFYEKNAGVTSWIVKLENVVIWFGVALVFVYGLFYALVSISKGSWSFFKPNKKWTPRDETLAKSRAMFDVYATSREYLYRQNRFRAFSESEV